MKTFLATVATVFLMVQSAPAASLQLQASGGLKSRVISVPLTRLSESVHHAYAFESLEGLRGIDMFIRYEGGFGTTFRISADSVGCTLTTAQNGASVSFNFACDESIVNPNVLGVLQNESISKTVEIMVIYE